MIRGKPAVFIILLAFLTALTLAGSLVLSFSVANWFIQTFGETEAIIEIIPMAIVVLFAIPMLGGAAWGFGIALLMLVDKRSTTWSGALAWGISILTVGFVLYVIMEFGPQISARLPFPMSVHTFFNLLFVPAIGLAAGLNARNMSGKIGFESFKNAAGKNAGLAAALGFLLTSLVLQFGLGWEVGRPVPGKYSMIIIMHWGNFAATLAGGAAMGWTLLRGHEEIEISEHDADRNLRSSNLAPPDNNPAYAHASWK